MSEAAPEIFELRESYWDFRPMMIPLVAGAFMVAIVATEPWTFVFAAPVLGFLLVILVREIYCRMAATYYRLPLVRADTEGLRFRVGLKLFGPISWSEATSVQFKTTLGMRHTVISFESSDSLAALPRQSVIDEFRRQALSRTDDGKVFLSASRVDVVPNVKKAAKTLEAMRIAYS